MYGVINRIVPIVLFTMTEPMIRTKKEDFWLHPRSTNLLLFFLLTKSYPHIHTAYYYEIPFFLLHNIVSSSSRGCGYVDNPPKRPLFLITKFIEISLPGCAILCG